MTKVFGLIGHPLSHSFSRAYFTEKFAREGLDCEYQNFDLPTLASTSLRAWRSQAWQSNLTLQGFNVTIPYKEAILPYLDELDPIAAAIGAVNTVAVLPDDRLKGYNTDVIGFLEVLHSLGVGRAKRAQPKGTDSEPLMGCVLGTGGASKAVQYALHQEGIAFHTVSRSPKKGDFTYADLTPEIIREHRLIVNATPVGMFPNINEAPAIPYEALTSAHVLIDLIYNPEETLFLKKGKALGATTLNGLAMLHAQADAAWDIWKQFLPIE